MFLYENVVTQMYMCICNSNYVYVDRIHKWIDSKVDDW